jgi:hypothetical protein
MKTKILTKNFDPVNGVVTVKAQTLSPEFTCWCNAKKYTFEFEEGIGKKEIIEQTMKLLSVMVQ